MAKKEQVAEQEEVLVDESLELESNGFEEFFAKYKNILLGGFGAVIIIGVALTLFLNFQNGNEEKAQLAIYKAQYYWGLDSLTLALEGNDNFAGFVTVSNEYSGTKAGNFASFAAGRIYLDQKEFDKAIEFLGKCKSEDVFMQPKAYTLTGDAYMEKNEYAQAASFYEKASEYQPNEFFTPDYLMKLALALELNNQNKEALVAYEKIEKEYPKYQRLDEVLKYKAKAKALSAN